PEIAGKLPETLFQAPNTVLAQCNEPGRHRANDIRRSLLVRNGIVDLSQASSIVPEAAQLATPGLTSGGCGDTHDPLTILVAVYHGKVIQSCQQVDPNLGGVQACGQLDRIAVDHVEPVIKKGMPVVGHGVPNIHLTFNDHRLFHADPIQPLDEG